MSNADEYPNPKDPDETEDVDVDLGKGVGEYSGAEHDLSDEHLDEVAGGGAEPIDPEPTDDRF